MIRVRLVSEPEYEKMRQERTCKEYCVDDFYDLLREKGDFTDGDSSLLLRTLHGEDAVTGKWYRRTTPPGAPCLPALSQEAKYGLVVLENSRNGVYTNLVKDLCAFEVEGRMDGAVGMRRDTPLVWDAFAAMDRDVLLTFRKKEFDFGWDIPLENGFILENYPGDDGPMEVWVRERRGEKETEHNGMPCVDNFFYKLQYNWRKETGELLDVLQRLNGGARPLAKGLFPLSEFQKMLGEERWSWYPKPDWGTAGDGEESQGIQVLNHMDFLPADTEARRLRYLIIDKYADGSYCLRSEISDKYPIYEELLSRAMDLAAPGGESLVLPVDVEEVLLCAGDISKAACAFRVAGNVVETFGPKEGLVEFEKLLREALDSGRCAVPEED